MSSGNTARAGQATLRALAWAGRLARGRAVEMVGGTARARVIVMFGAVLALNGADNATIGAVAPQLEHSLKIGNTKIGLLSSVALLVGALFVIPVGFLVDRFKRMPMLAFSILLWSLASLLSAFAGSYSDLLLTRLLLGAVTATAGPAIASLTGDYFPADERGRVYAYILGGEVAGSAVGFIVSGSVGSIISWRAAFALLAVPGLFLARTLWRTVPEPLRGGQSRLAVGATDLGAAARGPVPAAPQASAAAAEATRPATAGPDPATAPTQVQDPAAPPGYVPDPATAPTQAQDPAGPPGYVPDPATAPTQISGQRSDPPEVPTPVKAPTPLPGPAQAPGGQGAGLPPPPPDPADAPTQAQGAGQPPPAPESDLAHEAVRRRGVEPDPRRVLRVDPRHLGLVQSVRYIMSVPTNVLLIIGSALGYFFFAGLQTFAVEFVIGHYHVNQATADLVLVLLVVGAIAGTLISGRLTDMMLHRGFLEARVWVPALCYLGATALLVPGILGSHLTPALWFDIAGASLLSAANPPLDAARLDIMPAGLWGRAESTRTFLRSLAQALAPILFGGLADLIAGIVPAQAPVGTHPNGVSPSTARGLEISFLLMLGTLAAAGIFLARSRYTYAKDVATAAAGAQGSPE